MPQRAFTSSSKYLGTAFLYVLAAVLRVRAGVRLSLWGLDSGLAAAQMDQPRPRKHMAVRSALCARLGIYLHTSGLLPNSIAVSQVLTLILEAWG